MRGADQVGCKGKAKEELEGCFRNVAGDIREMYRKTVEEHREIVESAPKEFYSA